MTNPRPGVTATLLCLMTIFLAFGSLSCGCAPRPFISSISPNSATAGGSPFLRELERFRCSLVVINYKLGSQPQTLHESGSLLVLVFNPPDKNSTSVSGAISMGAPSLLAASARTQTQFPLRSIDSGQACGESLASPNCSMAQFGGPRRPSAIASRPSG